MAVVFVEVDGFPRSFSYGPERFFAAASELDEEVSVLFDISY